MEIDGRMLHTLCHIILSNEPGDTPVLIRTDDRHSVKLCDLRELRAMARLVVANTRESDVASNAVLKAWREEQEKLALIMRSKRDALTEARSRLIHAFGDPSCGALSLRVIDQLLNELTTRPGIAE